MGYNLRHDWSNTMQKWAALLGCLYQIHGYHQVIMQKYFLTPFWAKTKNKNDMSWWENDVLNADDTWHPYEIKFSPYA